MYSISGSILYLILAQVTSLIHVPCLIFGMEYDSGIGSGSGFASDFSA